jgi:phosphatidylglycerophosphate synthase
MNIAELRQICQGAKLRQNTGLTRINRTISIYFTRLFIWLNVSANQITLSGIILGILGSVCFMFGIWHLNILGVFLLYLSLTFDQVDGELARYYDRVNLNGVYLDEIRHLVIYAITIFCLSFPAAREMNSYYPFLLGFGGAISLTISRIEERLPYQIFTEKIILRRNFTAGKFNCTDARSHSDAWAELEKESAGVFGLMKLKNLLCVLFYDGFQFVSNQVSILFVLLSVTLIDRFLLGGQKLFGFLTMQSFFFVFFSSHATALTIKVIYGHFEQQKVERLCFDIYRMMKQLRD